MNPEMPEHDELRERLGAYALGHLDADERAGVDEHLAGCESCRDELASITPLAGPLGRIDPDAPPVAAPEPSPAGFAAIMGRIRDEGASDATEPPTRFLDARAGRPDLGSGDGTVVPLRPRRAGSARYRLAAAAAVVAMVGLGAGYGFGAQFAGPDVDPVSVQAAAPGLEASAGTISHRWGVEVVLTGTGFDQGQVYRVAVTDRSGRAESAGAFVGTGDRQMVCRLNSPVLPEQAGGFVVTDADGTEVLRSGFA